MRLYEFVTESVSAESAVRTISDVLTVQLPQLYQNLGNLAENLANSRGVDDSFIKAFQFVSGGPKKKWYSDVYFTHMNPALHSFSKFLNTTERTILQNALNNAVGGSFPVLWGDIIPALKDIARSTKNEKLSRAIQSAITSREQFDAKLSKIVASGKYDDYEDEIKTPSTPSIVGQQNAEVEGIIRDVLSRISPKHAGEIRNAIAKSSNKLAALQNELNKRNIRV